MFEVNRVGQHVLIKIPDGVPIRRRRRYSVDVRDESISLAGNRDDVVVLIGTLPKRTTERGDLADEVVLLHSRVRPHTIQQLFLADNAVAMLEQDSEDVKRLRRDRHGTVSAP
jgi:hypothetical protein